MNISDVQQLLVDRHREIEEYLGLLDAVEAAAQHGAPRLNGVAITATQQRILYSSVYLQLYNLVEATVVSCISSVEAAAVDGSTWKAKDLSAELRREWVRFKARTHVDQSYEHRLDSAGDLCAHLVDALPLDKLDVSRGGGGNWDDCAIEEFASKRLGLRLVYSDSTRMGVKRHVRNDQGALSLVKSLRNGLAHGSISFVECGAATTVPELRRMTQCTAAYLYETVRQFSSFIERHEFLTLASRPAGGA